MTRYVPPAKDPTQSKRCVYVLPKSMVEQIHEYARELGLRSEVDAVRRLLDEGLKAKEANR